MPHNRTRNGHFPLFFQKKKVISFLFYYPSFPNLFCEQRDTDITGGPREFKFNDTPLETICIYDQLPNSGVLPEFNDIIEACIHIESSMCKDGEFGCSINEQKIVLLTVYLIIIISFVNR
jgi:hypothetical protein